ncbi:MAG: hypothetical protein H0T71_14925, partial [Acidobacteria bacterium]|nr:hypothetical protein [Acidobacteriota bacterium]
MLPRIALAALLATVTLGAAERNGALPGPLPLLMPGNWWNQDISHVPVDARSAEYIAFINNGGTRRLHP